MQRPDSPKKTAGDAFFIGMPTPASLYPPSQLSDRYQAIAATIAAEHLLKKEHSLAILEAMSGEVNEFL